MTRLAPFELHRPGSVAEATELLLELGDDAAFYAGGTEVLLLMKLGLGGFGQLVDVKRLGELAGVTVDEAGTLRLGATATHRQIGRSPMVQVGWPVLADIESQVANIRVRTIGTLGGNLCFADPHSDPATWLLAADARALLALGERRRSLPVAEFLVGPWETALEPGELLLGVEVPPLPEGSGMSHLRFATHERPTATVSCLVRVVDGMVAEARVAVGSVGPRHARAPEAEALVVGMPADRPDASLLRAAGEAAATVAEPDTDSNGSAEYKADLVAVLVERAVRQAIARATGAGASGGPT
ncbi:MAG: FAD binding domain-containing protein [Chloroflexota bacterium]